MKKKQVMLFCGRFHPTNSSNLPEGYTQEVIKSVITELKKIESLEKWFLIDCKQNVQAFSDN